jgi:hypothetical protein
MGLFVREARGPRAAEKDLMIIVWNTEYGKIREED